MSLPGMIVGGYFGLGFSLHMLLWLMDIGRVALCPTPWPDVEVKNKRKSEGGEQAPVGKGHECYDYDTPGWPPYAIFKLVFGLLTGLLPFRFIAFVSTFTTNILIVSLGQYAKNGSQTQRCFDLLFAFGCKMLCSYCASYSIEVINKERLNWVRQPGEHPIIVPNHINLVEVHHFHYLYRGMSGCVAKSQLSIPGIGAAARYTNGVVIDPKDKDVKEKVKEGITKYAKNPPNADGLYPCSRAFVIYPEGITNSHMGLYRFNLGPFSPGVPVLPVIQRFPYKHMNPAWVSASKISTGNDLPWVLIRYMTQFTMPLQVKIMDVWEPSEAEIKDPMLFASNVQNYMALQLGQPVTDTSNKLLREKGGPFDLKSAKVKPSDGSASSEASASAPDRPKSE